MREGLIFLILALWVLGGCGQETLAPASQATWTPRDRQLLANPPYAQAQIPREYQRHLVDYRRKEVPGTIIVDTSNRYLYYVLPQGKAIRYGITVGEEALAWSGIAKIGRKEEWPAWVPVPTQEIKHRLANTPDYVSPGRTIRWARELCISFKATRTRSTESMGPISRNTSDGPFRLVASYD